jgi:hypothetical protein
MTRQRPRPDRDQGASTFTCILEDLIDAIPFARAAAIFDFEGETVDYAGELAPFDVRVAAAHFQLVLSEVRERPGFETAFEVTALSERGGYFARVIDPGYGLLLILRRGGTFAVSRRALAEIEMRVLVEAGLRKPQRPPWYRVVVELGGKGARPTRLCPAGWRSPSGEQHPLGPWLGVEILGALVGLGPRQRGFRVRLENGAEMTLVRESRRLWFVDEPIASPLSGSASGTARDAVFLAKTVPPARSSTRS